MRLARPFAPSASAFRQRTTVPVFVCVSPTHEHLFADHFLPTIEQAHESDFELVRVDVEQVCPSGITFSVGWLEQIRAKVETILAACSNPVFVFSDADVVFLGPWLDLALASLGQSDLAWIGEPSFSPAFFVARGSERLAAMLRDVLERWDSGGWRGEGEALYHGLEKHRLKHHRLPGAFSNPGALGFPIALVQGKATFSVPEDVRVFHANFCPLPEKHALLEQVRALQERRKQVGLGFFPEHRPARPFDRQSMLTLDKIHDILTAVGDRRVSLIVEIGSWLGGSTRWFLETFNAGRRPGDEPQQANIICIDPWQEIDSLAADPQFAPRMLALWDQWCANCWEWRHAITPVRLRSSEGIPLIAEELLRQGREPDIVYIDGDHSEQVCYDDIVTTARTWRDALIVGDGYYSTNPGDGLTVRSAVNRAASDLGRSFQTGPSGTWWLDES